MALRKDNDAFPVLPTEIYDQIGATFDQTMLVSLCRVSRRVREGFISRLYSTLSFDLEDSMALKNPHGAALALRSLLANPSLIKYVQQLVVDMRQPAPEYTPCPEDMSDTWLSAWSYYTKTYPCIRDYLVSTSRARLSQMSIPQPVQEIWLYLLAKGRVEAIIALLIVLCTNVQSIQLGSRIWISGVLDDLLKHSSPELVNHATRFVTLCPDVDHEVEVWFHICTYASLPTLLRLPNIIHLSAPLVTYEFEPETFHLSSNLQTLTLKWSQLSEEALGIILRSTPQLRKLTFWGTYCEDGPLYCREKRPQTLDDTIDGVFLEQSLNHVQTTLEELFLSFQRLNYGFDSKRVGLRGAIRPMHALRDFQQLKILEIPYIILLGWTNEGSSRTSLVERLPPNLQDLTLTNDLLYLNSNPNQWSDADLLQQLEPVVEKLGACSTSKVTPRLTVNRVLPPKELADGPDAVAAMLERQYARLLAMCDDHGVQGNVITEENSHIITAQPFHSVGVSRPSEYDRVDGAMGRLFRRQTERSRIRGLAREGAAEAEAE